MYWFFLALAILTVDSSYLSNTKLSVNYSDLPNSNFLNNKNINTPVSFGCSLTDNNDNLYLMSSTQQYTNKNSYNEERRCTQSKKYVEVLKYNKVEMIFLDTILIGDNTPEFPNAVGDLGSDNVVSCGFDSSANLIYYIVSNYYNCPSAYKLESSIVRINSNTFKFIDRTILRNIQNIPTFSDHTYYDYKYIYSPTTSEIIDGESLWLGFGSYSTGIWQLNITTTTIKLINSFRKNYKTYLNIHGIQENIETTKYLTEIKKSFKNKDMIYFVEDTGWGDAMVLSINTSLPLSSNNTMIHKMEGINYISVIKTNPKTNIFYVITGLLTSEMYQYDFDFNKIMLNENCNIDFLKFPTEWGVITGMEVDYKTGFLYPIISNRYENSGIAKINMKNMELDMDSHKLFRHKINIIQGNYEYSYFVYYFKYNISHIDLNIGKIFLVYSNGGGNDKKIINVELYGCSEGKGILNNACENCQPGKFTNIIGGNCKFCITGYASSDIGSYSCKKCEMGKFSDGINTIFCMNCPIGKYSEITGSSQCINCIKGKFSIISPSNSFKNCRDCQTGRISMVGASFCESCQMGEWAKNNKICVKCSQGKYSDKMGIITDTSCKPCLIGFYNDETGLINSNQCKKCSDGEIGLINGATSNATCSICDSGKFKIDVDKCENCLPGRVSKKKSMTCGICIRGKYSNAYQSDCVECPLGKFNDFDGASNEYDCISCLKGRYSNTTNLIKSSDWKKCALGKYNKNSGSISINSCIECKPGEFNDNLGSDNCKICIPGFFSHQGSTMC